MILRPQLPEARRRGVYARLEGVYVAALLLGSVTQAYGLLQPLVGLLNLLAPR